MQRLYARLECLEQREGFALVAEPLEEHLVDTAVAACILARRLDFDPYASTLAAALHDVGKVLHNLLQRRVVERVEQAGCSRAWRLSFTYHEILSAALYGYHMWFEGRAELRDRIVSRAILLHHQGLRGLETRVYLDGLAWISSNIARMSPSERKELVDTIAGVLERVSSMLRECRVGEGLRACCDVCRETLRGVAGAVRRLAETVRDVGIETILENASTLLGEWISVPENAARNARSVSGVLMLADNAVAVEHAGLESRVRLYPHEARWLANRSIEALCAPRAAPHS